MNVVFEPAGAAQSSLSTFMLRSLLAVQRFSGHRLGIRLGKLFVAYEKRRRSSAALTIAYRASSVFMQPESGTLVSRGGFNIEDNVQLKVNNGTIGLGDGVRLHKGAMLTTGDGEIFVGDRSHVGPYTVLYGRGTIRIGNDVMVSPHCVILAENHGTAYGVPYVEQPITKRGITIDDNVWLGAGVTVLDGITIGTGAIVAAGSVVMRNVAPYTIVSGSPARVVRAITANGDSAAGPGARPERVLQEEPVAVS